MNQIASFDSHQIPKWDFLCNYIGDEIVAKDDDFTKQFSSIVSNNERVKMCLSNGKIRNFLNEYMNIVTSSKHKKFWEKSNELRIDGNDLFQSKRFDDSIECYTAAILSAPLPDDSVSPLSPELSLSYANRSAAFYQKHEYDKCLKDISMALKFNYPLNLTNKLIIRKVKCLKHLGKNIEARDTLNDAIGQLTDSNAKMEFEKLLRSLPESDRKFSGNKNGGDSNRVYQSPFDFQINPEMPNASVSIEMCHSPTKGRFIKAKKDIKMCDILFMERPFASVLLPQFYKSQCHHCYKNIVGETVVPCRKCNYVRYCGEECADMSWSEYHNYECGHLDLLHDIGIAHLALRIVLMCGVKNAINCFNDDTPKNGPFANDYKSVLLLLDHSNEYPFDDAIRYSLTAALLLLLLTEKLSLVKYERDDSYTIGGLLLKHIQQLICNGHAISAPQLQSSDNHIMIKDVRIATGIYPTVSLMNHNCNPNVIPIYDGAMLISRASRNISMGQEIVNCYGPHCMRMPKNERKNILKMQYFFDCDCKECSDDNEITNFCRSLLCQKCNGPVNFNDDDHKSGQCLKCKSTNIDASQLLDDVEMGLNLVENGSKLIDERKLRDAEEELLKAHKILSKNLYEKNRNLGYTKDELSRCYAQMGEWDRAVQYCRESVEIVKDIYGDCSVELCHELLKLSDLEWKLIESVEEKSKIIDAVQKCLKTSSRAIRLVTIYANPFEMTENKELKTLHERLLSCAMIDEETRKM